MDEGSAPPDDSGDVSLSQIPTLLIIRGVLMMLVAIALVGGLHAYLALRLVAGSGLMGPVAWGLNALFVALFVSIPAGFAAGRGKPSAFNRVLLWTAHLWLGAFGVLLSSILAAELIRIVASFFVEGGLSWDGRWSVAVAGVAGVAVGWGIYVARFRPARVVSRRIPVKDLAPGMNGVRVVQISDLHIGQTLGKKFLRRIVAQVNALDADIVAVTGDLVDGFVHSTRDQVAPLGELSAKLGRFYVTGNHEYYYGGPAWEAEVGRLGLTVLHNQHEVLTRDGAQLVIAGVTDHDSKNFSEGPGCRPDVALKGAPREVPRVLLAHQPRSAFLVNKDERVDLQLSGHTHGGQIFPFMFFVRLQQPAIAGLKMVNGVRVYTHSGTGYWGPPMRVGPAPEIAVLELVSSP